MAKIKKSLKDSQSAAVSNEAKIDECNDAYTRGAFKYLRLLVHLLGAGQFIGALYYWHNSVKIPEPPESKSDEDVDIHWGGKLKFLTFLDVILQAVYHSIALLNDFFGTNCINPNPMPLLRRLKDYVFSVLAFPIAHNVCLSFWVVYAFDRELIFPSALDAYFPNWLNHVVHTNVAMLMIMDMFTCFRIYPKRSTGIASISSVMLLYLVWLHVVRYHAGRWAYPMFDVLNAPMRYFMLFGMVFVSVVCYLLGEFVNNTIWAPELKLLREKSKLKTK